MIEEKKIEIKDIEDRDRDRDRDDVT